MPKSIVNKYQNKEIEEIKEHLGRLNEETGDIRKELTCIKVDVASIKTTQKIVLAFIMMALAGLIGLFIK